MSAGSVINVRSAGVEDLLGLRDLLSHLHPNDPLLDEHVLREALSKFAHLTGSAVLVAEGDAGLVATATLIVVPNLTRAGRPFALIENVVTHPAFRNQGIGTALLSRAVAVAWGYDCYKVMLLTGSLKPEVLGFYQGLGFQQTKTGLEIRRIPKRVE